MTEPEWLAESDLYLLANALRTQHHQNRSKAGRRKLRLFGCACCRRAWPLFANELQCAELVQAAERFADGDGSTQVLARLDAALPPVQSDGLGFHLFAVHAARTVASTNAFAAAVLVAQLVAEGTRHVADSSGVPVLNDEEQTTLLRDIFGNPFRPVTVDPRWLTADVVSLARGIYAERAFDRLPILADALQDAGCDNADVLGHCRDQQLSHVRGCWVVDLVLGKA